VTLERRRTLATLASLVLVWEVVGRLGLVADGALPSLSAIAASLVQSWAVYPPHLAATLSAAGTGFVLGNAVAIVLALAFALVPVLQRVTSTLLVTLFCLPIVVVAPILGIAYHSDWPKIILAALAVFFPTMISTLVGLRTVPPGAVEVVRASGGGRLRAVALVRLRHALPDLLAGLQVAAPAAMLGALLGEFLGGRRGLGVYLLGSMGRAEPATLWAIGLVAAGISAAAYGLLGLVRRSLGAHDVQPIADPTDSGAGAAARPAARVLLALTGVVVLLGAWYAFVGSTGLPTTVMNTPLDVWHNLVSGENAARTRESLLPALGGSLLAAVVGSLAGIAVAWLLAVALTLVPAAARVTMPFAFLSQTMPIIALVPLIALLFGRGTLTVVVVTISVTFFPALVTIQQGLAKAPQGQLDVLRSVDASRWTTLRLVTIPNATPYLLASVRLAAPRALVGVLLAEQFVTGTGLGGLLGASRGYLDYRMMWVITAVVAVVAVLTYAAAEGAERVVQRRRA
ncbi:ABC transporter permease subunit, partial [Georgenia ruanii]|nr:ABC transporter permease subunit [Georgenia ruanii]